MVTGRVPRMQWLGIGFSDNRRMVSNATDGVFIYFILFSLLIIKLSFHIILIEKFVYFFNA